MATEVEKLDTENSLRDIESFIKGNKWPLLLGVLSIFLGIAGYGFYKSHQSENHQIVANKAYSFSLAQLKQLEEDKITTEDFLKSYNENFKEFSGKEGPSFILLKSVDVLMQKKKYTSVISLLEENRSNITNIHLSYLLDLRLAAAYEETNQFDKALAVYEKMSQSAVDVARAQIYLNIGRVYSYINDLSKAELNFNYVIQNFKDDADATKLAKLFLDRLKTN